MPTASEGGRAGARVVVEFGRGGRVIGVGGFGDGGDLYAPAGVGDAAAPAAQHRADLREAA